MKKKDFLNQIEFPKLASSVIKQLDGWGKFKVVAVDIANNSLDDDYHWFKDYKATVKFSKANLEQIVSLASYQAQESGQSIDEVIYGLGCMMRNGISKYAFIKSVAGIKTDVYETVMNCLARYAVEEVCDWYNHIIEREEE